MGQNSSIEWTQATWNPFHGCLKISPGCAHCYMYRDKKRYGQDPTQIVRSKTRFNDPLKWKEPRFIFTCSWSDFFIEQADPWRDDAWDVIRSTPQHTYQILTKRPERIAEHLPADWPLPNVWLGVSIENPRFYWRIGKLQDVHPVAVRFLSVEPMLQPVPDLPLGGISWVIVGGESGPEAREMKIEWARQVRDTCRETGVKFFMKQLGGAFNKRGKMEDFPEDLRIREMPRR